MSYADQQALAFWREYDDEERWLNDIEDENLSYDAPPAPEESTHNGRNTGDSK